MVWHDYVYYSQIKANFYLISPQLRRSFTRQKMHLWLHYLSKLGFRLIIRFEKDFKNLRSYQRLVKREKNYLYSFIYLN